MTSKRVMYILGLDPGWRNCGACMIEYVPNYDTLAPLAQWVDDLLGEDRKFHKNIPSATLLQLLNQWKEKRKDVLQLADVIVIEWQKDRKLNMLIPFLEGAFSGKVVYLNKSSAHLIHRVPLSGNNHKNKVQVMQYMCHFMSSCPDTSIPAGVEVHHAHDAAFLATAYCLKSMYITKNVPCLTALLPCEWNSKVNQ